VIRKDVALDVAALVGCAVATGVGAAMFTARVRPGESVLVIGCGGVGLSVIKARGCAGRRRSSRSIHGPKRFGRQSTLGHKVRFSTPTTWAAS
jgi:Zn-dependent alcohol dehydrogenase